MNLAFKKTYRGYPTYFPHMILLSLLATEQMTTEEFGEWLYKLKEQWPECICDGLLSPKHHTIRTSGDWELDKLIHFIINNRSKDRYQFAPIMKVKKVDDVVMTFDTGFDVQVNGSWLDSEDIERMAVNDGFNAVEDMAEWFFPNEKVESFSGKIIHWTDQIEY